MTDKQLQSLKKQLPPISHWDKWTPQQRTMEREIWCREMINSCLIYGNGKGFYNPSTGEFGHYAQMYLKDLGEKRVLELWTEQVKDFSEATVMHNVYTDFEGCTYNSIKWADD